MNVVSGKLSIGSPALGLRRFRRKTRAAFVVVMLGAFTAPFAIAHWSSSGTGTGAASAGTLQPVAIDTVAFGLSLRPAGPATNVTVHVSNPNDYAVVIDGVTAGTIHSDKLGCDGVNTGVSLDLAVLAGNLPPGASTFVASASMTGTSASACQGARFTSVLTLAVHK